MWNSFKIAFSMYSKIPMPNTDWNKNNMKYAICFFPMIGIVIGILTYLWSLICNSLDVGNILKTSMYIFIPILITGGIHIDGFIDTMDAINSYQNVEKKLEILKDPHIGAFALIGTISYFIISLGFWSEITTIKEVLIISIGYVISRALSGYSIANFKCAKNSGLAATFSNSSEKKIVTTFMFIYTIIGVLAMLFIDITYGITSVCCISLSFIYYKYMSMKKFNGITGDLAGFFLQICELSIVIGIVIINYIL